MSPSPMSTPGGPHGLVHEIAAAQAHRLRDAIVDQVASRGYESTTVAHVVGAARVSYAVFYSRFESKADCYRDAMESFTAQVQAASAPIVRRDGEPPLDGLERSLRGYLGALARSPARTRCLMLAPLDPEDGGHADNEAEPAIEALMASLPTRDRFACVAYRAMVRQLVADEVREGRTAQLESLADPVMGLVRHHLRAG